MNETEIAAALAEQEEHIKRSTSCNGVYCKSHDFRTFGSPRRGRMPVKYSACIVCGVTETRADYETKLAALPGG